MLDAFLKGPVKDSDLNISSSKFVDLGVLVPKNGIFCIHVKGLSVKIRLRYFRSIDKLCDCSVIFIFNNIYLYFLGGI